MMGMWRDLRSRLRLQATEATKRMILIAMAVALIASAAWGITPRSAKGNSTRRYTGPTGTLVIKAADTAGAKVRLAAMQVSGSTGLISRKGGGRIRLRPGNYAVCYVLLQLVSKPNTPFYLESKTQVRVEAGKVTQVTFGGHPSATLVFRYGTLQPGSSLEMQPSVALNGDTVNGAQGVGEIKLVDAAGKVRATSGRQLFIGSPSMVHFGKMGIRIRIPEDCPPGIYTLRARLKLRGCPTPFTAERTIEIEQ